MSWRASLAATALTPFLFSHAPVQAGALAEAAARQDVKAVHELLRKGQDPDQPDAEGTPALAWLVSHQEAGAARAVLAAGADPDLPTRLGLRPVHIAIANADQAALRLLLQAGADADALDPTGESALMLASRSGEPALVSLLLEHGASVDLAQRTTGQTALMVAARQGDGESVAMLLRAGASVDAQALAGKVPAFRLPASNSGSKGAGIVRGGWPERGERDPVPGAKTALLYAAREGHVAVVRQLLTAGADIEKADANGVTPLLMAVLNGQLGTAKVLLESGANVNAVDWYGQTALFAAVDLRNVDVSGPTRDNGVDRAALLELIRLLLAQGADVNARTRESLPQRRWITRLGSLSWVDFTGQTPFLRAALAGDVTVMRLLLEHGADAGIPTFGGTTPLMAAAGINWTVSQTFDEGPEATLQAALLCIEQGNDVNAVNSMGLQAIHGAANRGADDIVRLLAKHGAQLDRPDNEGRTPLVWAEGVFLATHPPVAKPETMALLQQLRGSR